MLITSLSFGLEISLTHRKIFTPFRTDFSYSPVGTNPGKLSLEKCFQPESSSHCVFSLFHHSIPILFRCTAPNYLARMLLTHSKLWSCILSSVPLQAVKVFPYGSHGMVLTACQCSEPKGKLSTAALLLYSTACSVDLLLTTSKL